MTHIEKLRSELDDVKKKLNHQLPDSNLWTNFALESHGTTHRFDRFQLQLKCLDFCFDVQLPLFAGAKVYKKRSSSTYERIGGIKIFGFQPFSKVGPVTVIRVSDHLFHQYLI